MLANTFKLVQRTALKNINRASLLPLTSTLCTSASTTKAKPVYEYDNTPGVVSDPSYDVRTLKVPYLRDNTRQEIYAKFCTNPEQWTVRNLATYYSAHPDRIKAVLILMKKRYDIMESYGFTVRFTNNNTIDVIIPPHYLDFYTLHMENPTQTTEELIETYNLSRPKFEGTVEEVAKIVENMKDHTRRLQNLQVYEASMLQNLDIYDSMGIPDAFNFNETFVEQTRVAGNLEYHYYPFIFNDEDEVDMRKHVDYLIEKNFKPFVEVNLDYYTKKQGNDPKPASIPTYISSSPVGEKAVKAMTESTSAFKTNPEKLNRWKYSFTDTSKKSYTDANSRVIKTRSGEFRKLNALELAQASWTKNMDPLDFNFIRTFPEMYKARVTPFINVEGDDHIPKQIAQEKLMKKREATGGKKK